MEGCSCRNKKKEKASTITYGWEDEVYGARGLGLFRGKTPEEVVIQIISAWGNSHGKKKLTFPLSISSFKFEEATDLEATAMQILRRTSEDLDEDFMCELDCDNPTPKLLEAAMEFAKVVHQECPHGYSEYIEGANVVFEEEEAFKIVKDFVEKEKRAGNLPDPY